MASYYLLLSFLIPLLLLLLSKLKSSYRKPNYRLPPGPWSLPIIGSLHHFIGRGLPHHALWDLSQQYGGLMFLQLGENPTVIVSSKQAAKEILKTNDLKFCDRPINNALKHMDFASKDIIFTPYSELWRKLRKVAILELLTARRVKSLRSIHEEEVSIMIKHITSVSCNTKQFLNLRDAFLSSLTDIALRSVVGSTSKEKNMIVCKVLKIVEFIALFKLPNMYPSLYFLSMITGVVSKAKQCRTYLEQFLGEIIKERKQKEGSGDAVDDIISVLLRLYDEESKNDGFTMDNVIAVVFDLISASIVNPMTLLEWAMSELIKNPELMKTAQAEIRQQLQGREHVTESDLTNLNIVHLIMKETMRLYSGLLLPRECRETCNILGYDIPKGTTVVVNTCAMGRNPDYWKDADEFKPERFLEADHVKAESDGEDFKFIPFGAGRRMCPGTLLSFSVMELVLANLLYHFDWELPDGMSPDELDMTEEFALTTRRKYPLLLRAILYQC